MLYDLDDEHSELVNEPPQILANDDDEEQAVGVVTKRSRRKLPEQWTRVISLSHDDLFRLKQHPIATELLLAEGYQEPDSQSQWQPYFSPRGFEWPDGEVDLKDYKLTNEQLLEYGEQVTKLRADI